MKNNYKFGICSRRNLGSWWMGVMSLMLVTMLWSSIASAQTAAINGTTYPMTSSTGASFQDSTGGTAVLFSSNDDTPSGLISFGSGFTFQFAGRFYTGFSVSPDGFIRLGSAGIGQFTNDLTSNTNVPIIAAYWDDLATGTDGYAKYKLSGVAPNRIAIFDWFVTIPRNTGGPANSRIQMSLFESTGQIEFVYGGHTDALANYSVGVRDTIAGVGQFASLTCAQPITSTTASYVLANNANTTAFVAGDKITFTPPAAPASPTSLSFSAVTVNSMTLDWADATGEIGYVVERSLDGITYTRVAVLGANAISYTASGLTASQTYYWNVRSLSEGQMSDPALNGNQATAAGIVCGTFSVGPTGTYATITAALNDIRTNGLSCSAILELQAAYTSGGETFPIWTGGLGTVASKTVTIRPELGAVALSITSANSWTTVLDSLTEYLTIDGRPGGAGVVSELTTQNTVLTGSAMRILQESSNNNFSYINFRGSSNTVANGVVFMGGSTIVGGSGNDNNTFDNCDIHEAGTLFPVNCFISTGTASASNDNNTISNCRIYNFYSATLATVGINVGAGNVSMTITGNRIYQDASRNYTTGNIHKGIVANNTLSSFTITNNIIGYASSSGTGTYSMAWAATAIANRFFGMDLNVAISPVSTISGNEIASFNIATNSTGTGSGAPFCGIWLNAGGANITGNTVGSMTGTDNILVRGTATGGSATTANVIGIAQGAASASSISISNNNIGGLGFNGITAAFANAAAIGGTVCGIFNQGATTLTVATSNRTISGNTIGGTGIANSMRSGNALNAGFTTTANFSVIGILNTGSTRMTISNNTVQNLRVPTRSSAGVVYGISTTTGINTISGNTIKVLSSNAKNVAAATTAHLNGINHTSTTVPVAGTEVNISGNTIFDLKMSADTGRVVVNGIAYTGTTTVGFNQLIQKNLIYDLNDLTTASDTAKHVFIGIGLYGGLPTVQNNMIQVGLGNTRSQDYYGIYKANTNINRIYHNSVYVGGDASVASGVLQGNTYGFRRVNRPTTGNDEIINNIFYNARTSAVGGLQYAIALDSNINVTSSKNVLFADFANGGRTGIRNLTVASSLTDWRTLTGLDLNSISEDPNYIAPAASTPDLHIQPSPAVTPVESAGLAISGPADDFDGQARAGFTPIDIGADAGDFVASGDFLSPTIISVVASPAGSACVAASRLVSVDASDASGILGVDLNWSLNGVAQTAIVMVFNGGTNLWEGTIPASGNALVSFSATATDNSVNLNATTSASQSYRDEYLFAGLSAGVDQTICPGTSTNLSVASPYLNSIVFSEISGFESGSAGAGVPAPGITGFDYIELTNIGNQPVDISGWRLEVTGTTPGVYIIPAGNTVPAGGTFTLARTGGGVAIPGYYVNSTLLSIGSGTSQGYIISDLGGNISDVAAINGGTPFNPVGSGTPAVTAAMWSGTVTSSVSTAGIRRTAFSDSNTAADWTVASAGNLTNWGTFNVGLGNILVANISWSSGGTGSIENVTPVASPTEYVVTLNDGVCTATDTVNVNWFTTLPAPVGVDSMHCGNQQAKCDIYSVPGATAYRWYTTPTGGTPVQNTIDTNLLINVATTTTFYVAAFDGVCDGPRVAVTETVVQPDPIDIVSALGSSICLGEVDTLDVVQTGSTNTYLYTWSGDGVGTLNVNSGAQVISTPIVGGVYTFVVLGDDAAAGCVITDTLILTVNNNPVVSTNISSAILCLGDSIALSSSAYVVEGATGTPPTYLPSTATDVDDEEILNVTFGSINQSSTCATTGSGPGSVLNMYSNYTDIAPAIVAPGQSVPFSVTVGYCGLTAYSNTMNIYIDWNQDGDFLDLDELAFAKPYGAAALTGTAYTGNILVPLTALGGSTRLRVVLVESTVISPTGTYTWGETEDYSILVASQSGLTYSWAPAAGLSDPNISNPMATPAVTTTYVLTVEKTATGCSTTANVQIDVLPVPNTPTTNNSAHCGNQIPTASVDPVAGATAYYWYDAAVGGNILQADPSLTFLSSVGTTTTMYVAAFDGSCYSSRAAITITVSTPPAIIASADDSTVCLGSTIALSSTANGYTDFAWSVNGNGNLLTNNTQNVNATPTSAGSYNYIVTVSGGTGPNLGCVTSDTVEVEVFNLPTVISINIADTTLCQGQATSVVVNAIPSSVTTGPQTPPSGYLASNATNTIDEDINGVTFATLNNTQTAPNCATYTDFTSLPATDLTAGSTYPISISITDCELSGFFSAGTAVYIDYNRDGDFLDVNELAYTNNITINGPHIVNGSITVPLTAVAGVTRMRVVNTEGSLIPTSTGTYGYGETEDYLVNVSSFVPTLTYSWSPAGDFSDPSAANTSYIGSSVGANVITVTILDTVSGCSNTANRTIYVDPVPAAPVCAGDTICGQGDVTLTATGSLNELFWTEGNGGNILAVNDTLVQNVSASGSFQVREFPNNLDTTAVGYDPILYPSAPAGYFPTTAQGMWFRVDNASGTIIKSVDIYPNGPIGTPYGIEIIDSLGNTIGSVSGVTTVTLPNYETIEINIFVPYSTIPYAMRPTSSPNLAVHQNATVSGTSPWVIAGEMTIIAYGNMPPLASYFGATTFGMFYNWQVMHGCFGSSCIADYVVNPAPALSITAGGPTTFCGNGSVSLDASALPTDPSYVNFNWSPATGLNTTTGGIVTASVSTTTTYTVTADDGIVGGCANSATITITVNTAPFADAGVVPDTICTTAPYQFNGSGGSASYKYVGTTENLGQTAGWPFNGANAAQRMQLFVSAAELNAAGVFGPSFINSVGFNVVSKLSNQPYTNFTVDIDEVVGGCFASTTYIAIPGGNTVYTGNYSTSVGWNDIVFQTPYAWDGVSDIVIQTCFTNATNSLFDIVYTSQTLGCTSTNALNAAACGAATGALTDFRPNLRFQGGSVNYSWAPATELDNAAISNPLFTQSLGQVVVNMC
ncbi:MAG: lamin tail domain-containing protein [Bacteroidetes bacterium]|nr:lamin tail domain-containing protein [Bacteroidota bacterium]